MKPIRGTVGMKLAAGDVVLTKTGRTTTPFPELKFGTERKTSNTLRRVDLWLHENALAEAKATGDDFGHRLFASETGKSFPQAVKDCMEEYLFGQP